MLQQQLWLRDGNGGGGFGGQEVVAAVAMAAVALAAVLAMVLEAAFMVTAVAAANVMMMEEVVTWRHLMLVISVANLTLATRGLEEPFFQLCCCVSFLFWRKIGFGFTYYLCT